MIKFPSPAPTIPESTTAGVPDRSDNAQWNHFWLAKLLAMSRAGVRTYSRPLRYRNKTVGLPGNATHS